MRLLEYLDADVSFNETHARKTKKTRTVSESLYQHASIIGELLAYWYKDPDYLDTHGNPAAIKYFGSRPSFQELARRTVPNMDRRYLLSELERLGAVKIDEKKLIHVQTRSLPVYGDRQLAAQHTLTMLNGFIGTLYHNLKSLPANSEQLFHRIAWNGDFDSEEIPALKVKVKRHGQTFLESFDAWLSSKSRSQLQSLRRDSKQAQVLVGVYLSIDRIKAIKK